MTKVTEPLLQAGKSEAGGWSRAQLQLLSVPWPPPKGWKKAVLGKELPDEVAAQFVQLRGPSHDSSVPGEA